MSSELINILAVPAVLSFGAALVAVLGATRRDEDRPRPAVGLAALAVVAAASWALTLWPHGPAVLEAAKLTSDSLAQYAILVAVVAAALSVLVTFNQPQSDLSAESFAMILFMAAGLALAGLAADLLVLFLALELVSIPGYILVALSRRHRLAEEASAKYFFLGALSTALIAYGFVLLFGAAGATDLRLTADGGKLAKVLAQGEASTQALAAAGLIVAFAGLAFKLTAVPFYFYAADVYQGAAAGVTAVIAFLPKVAGFVAVLRICAWVGFDTPVWSAFLPVLCAVAVGTMTAGNVLAMLQHDVKRILAYSSVAHSGYVLVGLAVAGTSATATGLAAVLFYVVAYGVMTMGAFAAIAYLAWTQHGHAPRTEPSRLEQLAGTWQRHPGAALALGICVISLLGIPPTAGFWAKVYVFVAALTAGHVWLTVLVVVALVNAAVGAAYYLRIVAAAYMDTTAAGETDASRHATRPSPETPAAQPSVTAALALPISPALCAIGVIVIGLVPHRVFVLCRLAAQALLPP